ncbi:MAG TPA: LPS export ABC transporter permease LptF [Stellaceae bacterium]|nr:LPS export ABC transporter permease LptF [Stellaceae bacterium]
MSQLTRYILRQTLGTTLVVALVFTAAVWLVESLRLIDLIVNRGLSLGLFLYLALLILPRFIDAVLPIAVFIAVLFTYNRLISESEMIVMRSAGVSQIALARPAFFASVAGMLVLMAMSVFFLPASNRAFKDLQFRIRNKVASVLLLEGAFNTVSDNVTIYVRARDTEGDLSGIVIYDSRDKAKPMTIVAEHGAFVETKQGPRLVMAKGSRQIFDNATGHLSVLSFDRYTLDLDRYRETVGIRDRQPEELYLHELFVPRPGESSLARQARLVELNFRLINPLSALALGAIPLIFLLTGEFNRRGQLFRVLQAVGFAFLFEALDVGFKNMAVRNVAAIALLYLNVLLPIAIAAWLLTWRGGRGFQGIRRAAATA